MSDQEKLAQLHRRAQFAESEAFAAHRIYCSQIRELERQLKLAHDRANVWHDRYREAVRLLVEGGIPDFGTAGLNTIVLSELIARALSIIEDLKRRAR